MEEIIYENNAGDKYIIIDSKRKKVKSRIWDMVLIQFLDTGSTRWVYKYNSDKGKVKDLYKKTVYGVGYLGEVSNKPKYYKQALDLWRNMMKRCYTDDPKGYRKWGTTVEIRWHCFSTFLEDIKELDNFDKWVLGYQDEYEKYNLDKDFKVPKSNIYSRMTCSFVSEHLNKSEGAKTTVEGYYRVIGRRD